MERLWGAPGLQPGPTQHLKSALLNLDDKFWETNLGCYEDTLCLSFGNCLKRSNPNIRPFNIHSKKQLESAIKPQKDP